MVDRTLHTAGSPFGAVLGLSSALFALVTDSYMLALLSAVGAFLIGVAACTNAILAIVKAWPQPPRCPLAGSCPSSPLRDHDLSRPSVPSPSPSDPPRPT